MKLAVFAALVGVSLAACPDPDGVREHLVTRSCNANDPIQPVTITVTDPSGNPNYPIDVTKPILITANSNNKYTKVIQKLKASVDLYVWSPSTCSWHYNFLSYLLRGLNGCSIGKNCPLQPGALTLHQEVNLSAFAPIIKVLVSNEPYKLQIKLSENDDSSHKEVACIEVEALIKK